MSKTNKTKKNIQTAAFILFIIGLPMMSWYYLQAGFDYHKELMAELNNYGRVPEFALVDHTGDTLTREKVQGKLMVVNFFNRKKKSFNSTMDYMRRMTSQFHDRNDLVFAAHALETDIRIDQLNALSKKEELEHPQIKFLKGNQKELLALLAKGYQVPNFEKRGEDLVLPRSNDLINLPDEYPYFVLVDESGTIRNYYQVEDEKSVTRLVEHLAIILPRKAEEKAELKREKEK